jgi:hypothetical protein
MGSDLDKSWGGQSWDAILRADWQSAQTRGGNNEHFGNTPTRTRSSSAGAGPRGAGASNANPRRPAGIYAVVNIETELNQFEQQTPTPTQQQLEGDFNRFYQQLLADPAIAGLALQVQWHTVNPNPPGTAGDYDWTWVDIAFYAVNAWNSSNPSSPPKTVQLIVSAGFQTPTWVFAGISPCDGLFNSSFPDPAPGCGSVTFTGFQEGGYGTTLPLPWNTAYWSAWTKFLLALSGKYQSNPAFVSIAVAGPTAATVEIILPNDGNTPDQPCSIPSKTCKAPTGDPTNYTITPDNIWDLLLANAGLPTDSDDAFISAWSHAIDTYGTVFSGVTLIVTTGNGLPDFNKTQPPALSGPLAADCTSPLTWDCYAEVHVLEYLIEPSVGGANAKATQTSGMKASKLNVNVDLGIGGVKLLSSLTAGASSPSAQALGGAQFDKQFSGPVTVTSSTTEGNSSTVDEGCTSAFPPDASDPQTGCPAGANNLKDADVPVACIPQVCLAPNKGLTTSILASMGYALFKQVPYDDCILAEQAAYNVLGVFFEGTSVAPAFGAMPGSAPLNYLQIYSPDIQYAEANLHNPSTVIETNGDSVSRTAQELLNLASQALSLIAEPVTPGAPK